MQYTEDKGKAPSQCNGPITLLAQDADEHANNLTDWQQRYDQMSSGRFHGSITELAFDGLQVFHEYTSHQLHQKCNVWPDSLWLGIAANKSTDSRINGISVGDNDLMCRLGDREFELVTPKKHHIYGIVVSKKALLEVAETQGLAIHLDEFDGRERLAISDRFMGHLRFLLHRLLRESSALPGAKLQQDIVMMGLLEVLQSQRPALALAQSYQRRKQVVDRVSAYLEAHKDRPIRIIELCQTVGASRRTLQYSFESIVGISPIQYLRATRLNGVRRSLLVAHANTTVADVAADWGFLHVSQFTKDYKALFGECPSQTRVRCAA